MTEASTGLRTALARKAGVAKLSAEELLAQMTDEQKTSLAAALKPTGKAGDKPKPKMSDDEDEDDAPMGDKKNCKNKEHDHMDDKAIADAKAEERARFTTVMASDHYKGREQLASTLLANDKMSADEIVAALAAAPAPASGASDDADDRADMRNKLAAEQPAPTGQADDDATEIGQPQDWASIHAEVAKDRGLAIN